MESLMGGDQGSRSQMVGNLEELRARGQGVIESLSAIQLETLRALRRQLWPGGKSECSKTTRSCPSSALQRNAHRR